jgi:hypothetical protein
MSHWTGWLARFALVHITGPKRIESTLEAEKGRMRRVTIAMAAGLVLIAIGIGTYSLCFSSTPNDILDIPVVPDDKTPLPQSDEFEQLARTDPVAMLHKCLVRYEREVKEGFQCILEKEERVNGKLMPREEIALFARGDVPEPATGKTHIEVLMKWLSGEQKVFGFKVKGTLFVEYKGRNRDQIVSWRPEAIFSKETEIDVNGSSARGVSRYCIRDAGLYRGTLRTFEVWKQRKNEGVLKTEYLGKKAIEQVGGVECYIVKRLCETTEVDSFELGATSDMSPESIAQAGFTEVTVMIDAQRWLQIGTELRRANGELIGAYYFKNVELNPSFSKDTFLKDGLLKK